MAKTLTRGCTYDSETKMWAVWMNKPSSLTISDRPLYHKLCDCYVNNVTNRKGIHHFWRLANQEELNKTTIQFVTTLEDRKKIVDIRQEMALYQLTITSSLK